MHVYPPVRDALTTNRETISPSWRRKWTRLCVCPPRQSCSSVWCILAWSWCSTFLARCRSIKVEDRRCPRLTWPPTRLNCEQRSIKGGVVLVRDTDWVRHTRYLREQSQRSPFLVGLPNNLSLFDLSISDHIKEGGTCTLSINSNNFC